MPEIKLVYQQIKEYIEQELKSKKPGEFLGSEVQYSSLFNVSRPTVRKAVDELVNSGLVRRLPGKGLVVADAENGAPKGTMLFLIPYVPDDGFFYNMVMGCVDAANNSGFGYKIFNYFSPDERLEALKDINLSEYSAAVLTAYENEFDYELLGILERAKLPFVLVDNPVENYDCAHVITDDFKGGYLSGNYVIKKGHNKILYITLENNIQTVRRREKGFRKALEDNGISLPDEYIIRLKNDEEIMNLLPEIKIDYTAICGYSDLPVIMSYNILSGRGVQIPGQVSLMGYGNFKYSEILKVPLTTISIPVYDMGYRAVDMAVNIVKGSGRAEKITLDVGVVERSSVVNAY